MCVINLIIAGEPVVQARLAHHHHHRLFNFLPSKLFVFGDSYADTGNNKKSEANSWKYPYGITFPGKPAGRYSDGRVLTDFLGVSLSLSLSLWWFAFFFFLIFSSLFGIIDLLFIVYCHKWWVPTSLLACTNTMPLFFVIYNTDVCVWFSLSPVNFALLDQFFKIFFLFTFYLVRSLASYNSYDKLQSSFAHSLLSSPPIYLSLLFSHGSNAEPFLLKKKKKKKTWNGIVEMWLESPEDVKVIQIQKLPWNMYGFFY